MSRRDEHFLHSATGNRSYYAVAPLISLKDSTNPNAQKFVSAYREKYGIDPNPYSATGYGRG
jgi:ABC-type branched-subunit amino acid transport system substrate-binding protein